MDKIQSELAQYRGRFFQGDWPTIYQMFAISLAKYPKRPCFTTFDPNRRTYTYEEVDALIRKVATKLAADGVRKGDKVVLNGKNSI